jgi:hypothetical protein
MENTSLLIQEKQKYPGINRVTTDDRSRAAKGVHRIVYTIRQKSTDLGKSLYIKEKHNSIKINKDSLLNKETDNG